MSRSCTCFRRARDPHSEQVPVRLDLCAWAPRRRPGIAFYIAPKITDALLLGGFAALVLTVAWPNNRYAQLALTVFATGLWIDFSKDVLLFSRTTTS